MEESPKAKARRLLDDLEFLCEQMSKLHHSVAGFFNWTALKDAIQDVDFEIARGWKEEDDVDV